MSVDSKQLSPLEAFQLFCKELKIEDSDFAKAIETALKEVSGEDGVILSHIKNGKLHPLTTKCYQDLLKKQRALKIIKRFVDFNVYEMQGKYYLTTGNNYRGQIPISEEEYELLKEALL